jgi:hypothetical protein
MQRWRLGVASSLNYFIMSNNPSPNLIPYPNWAAHQLPTDFGSAFVDNNETIVSPYRVRADECDRLWVVDSGVIDVMSTYQQVAPVSIAIFDLNTDKLIRRYFIPSSQLTAASFLANIVSVLQVSASNL